MVSSKKAFYEEFAQFFEKPSRESLRELLRNNVGELPNCDFKTQWPVLPKVARHLLGIGNSGGGCLVAGVAEKEDGTLKPEGLEKFKDKAEIVGGIEGFIPAALLANVEILNFSYDTSEYSAIQSKKFQVVLVENDPKHTPYVSTADGKGIRNGAIYVRRGTSTEEANYEEVQRMINSRIETKYSSQKELDLQAHIEQLKVLFSYAPLEIGDSPLLQFFQVIGGRANRKEFEAFILDMIEKKKSRIEAELDV
jgi:predicted HTH transcriptional regulator